MRLILQVSEAVGELAGLVVPRRVVVRDLRAPPQLLCKRDFNLGVEENRDSLSLRVALTVDPLPQASLQLPIRLRERLEGAADVPSPAAQTCNSGYSAIRSRTLLAFCSTDPLRTVTNFAP